MFTYVPKDQAVFLPWSEVACRIDVEFAAGRDGVLSTNGYVDLT
jgi:hypothetical protein